MVERIAILIKGLSAEVSSQKLDIVVEMTKQMGPELSAGEVQMISKMVANSGVGSILPKVLKKIFQKVKSFIYKKISLSNPGC